MNAVSGRLGGDAAVTHRQETWRQRSLPSETSTCTHTHTHTHYDISAPVVFWIFEFLVRRYFSVVTKYVSYDKEKWENQTYSSVQRLIAARNQEGIWVIGHSIPRTVSHTGGFGNEHQVWIMFPLCGCCVERLISEVKLTHTWNVELTLQG